MMTTGASDLALPHCCAESNCTTLSAQRRPPWKWHIPRPWRIIRTAENVFGCKLLTSTIGGQHGGGAVLTPEARRLLDAYEAYVADVDAYSRKKFDEAFGFCRGLQTDEGDAT